MNAKIISSSIGPLYSGNCPKCNCPIVSTVYIVDAYGQDYVIECPSCKERITHKEVFEVTA